MTLTQMLQELYRRFGYATSPASEIATRFTALLNETLQEVISEPGLGAVLTRNEPLATVASVASQAVYAVVAPTSRIAAVTDRTNERRLEQRSLSWYRSLAPDPTADTGTPEAWVPLGFQAVAVQPSNASEIFVDSTSASDTGTAYLEGIRTGGYPVTLSVSMTGTTAVSLGTAYTDLIQITKFYISAAAVGTVTLHEDASGGTELARIPIGQQFSRYEAFALWPTPADAVTYYLESERELPDMANGADQPPFPARFHRILVDGAAYREALKKDDTRAEDYRGKYTRGLKQFRNFVLYPPDYDAGFPGDQVDGGSNLGAWYPSGRW